MHIIWNIFIAMLEYGLIGECLIRFTKHLFLMYLWRLGMTDFEDVCERYDDLLTDIFNHYREKWTIIGSALLWPARFMALIIIHRIVVSEIVSEEFREIRL